MKKKRKNIDLNLRVSGSAALDMAYVASGRLDGFYQKQLNIWDIAAGLIIIREAGGIISPIDIKKIKNSKIKKLIITDSIDNSDKIKNNNKIEVLSISSLMSEAIKRIANSNSVSDLFN